MWELIVKGGVVMAPIIALSIIALAIIIERLIAFLSIRLNVPLFAKEVFLDIQKGYYSKAADKCSEVKHPIGKLFITAISNRSMKREDLEGLLEREGNLAIKKLERGFGALAVIIGVEPMLGFLGTIVGLIMAFMTWEQLGTNITVSALAAGIYQAMITTAGGLIVSIPDFICYHIFSARAKYHAELMSYYGTQLLEVLSAARRGVPSENTHQ
jgi:biopolymer transport protein ExbB